VHTGGNRQEVGKRNSKSQKPKKFTIVGVTVSPAPLKPGAYHAVGIADVAVAENSQAGDRQRNDERIAGERRITGSARSRRTSDDAEKDHVVNASAPDGSFRTLGLLGAKVLANEGGGGVAETQLGMSTKIRMRMAMV